MDRTEIHILFSRLHFEMSCYLQNLENTLIKESEDEAPPAEGDSEPSDGAP